MATPVLAGGVSVKKRSPVGVWVLSIVTLGIYSLVWYYKINDEARRYLADDSIKPGTALAALFPGSIIYIPPFVSVYNTAGRIQRMQEKAGVESRASGALAIISYIFFGLFVVYLQSNLNKVWDSASTGGTAA